MKVLDFRKKTEEQGITMVIDNNIGTGDQEDTTKENSVYERTFRLPLSEKIPAGEVVVRWDGDGGKPTVVTSQHVICGSVLKEGGRIHWSVERKI